MPQCSGIFSLTQQAQASTSGQWCVDPFFKNTTLLLRADGVENGSQNNTFLDSSSNAFTITRGGNTTQGTFSPYGSLWSNYFDGSGDYLSLGTVASGGPLDLSTATFTVEAWVYLNSLTAVDPRDVITSSAASVVTNSNVDWALRVTDTGYAALTTCSGSGGLVVTSTTQLTVGWNHIAATRTSNSATVYVNGVGTTGTVYATTNTNRVVQIGQLGNIYSFAGYISNARVIKGTAVYTSNFTPSTTPLTAVSGTSLLTCQSNRFIDNSSNNFTLTVAGNTSIQRFSPFNPTAPYSAATLVGSGYFDGNNDYIYTPNSSEFQFGTGSFTLEAWIYPNVLVDAAGIISQLLTAADTEWAFTSYANGKLFFEGRYSVQLGTGVNAVKTGRWSHVVVVRSGTNSAIFVNGIRLATNASDTKDLSSATSVRIGRRALLNDFNGYIADARVVKGTAVYDPTQSTITVPTAPLTAVSGTALLCNFTNAGTPDAAMMNNLETVGNAQVSTSVKKYGTGSLAFDGAGDGLALPANINLALGSGDFTIEMWVYGSVANNSSIIGGGWPRLFTLGTVQGTGCIEVYIASGTFYVDISAAGGPISFSGSTLLTSSWNHFAITRSGTSLKAFVNGTQVGSTATNSTNLSLAATTQSWIGASNASAGNFNGYIDDLRITKGYARYTSNFTPPPVALQVQ